jgi:hypothetical protein
MILYTLDEIEAMVTPTQPQLLTQLVIAKMHTQIAQPRPGAPPGAEALCPFMPEALHQGTLRAGWFEAKTMPAIRQQMFLLQHEFFALPPRPPDPKHVFKAVVVVFPLQIYMDPEEQCEAFSDERIHLSINGFLDAGLMTAFFHLPQGTKDGGTIFIPLMIIRHMVKRDIKFLLKNNDPEEALVFRAAYERFFGAIEA